MDSQDFIKHFTVAAEFLASRKDEINKLNVFPVPDGDTGTNMSLTFASVVKELQELPASAGLSELRKAITHGSLMGARGNSGVITSQILRGFCEGLEGAVALDTVTLATALQKSVEVAFAAVRRPVEGTILTVIRDMSLAAQKSVDAGLDIKSACRVIVDEAFASVERTPQLLPVLKENGVVDAGGYGLALFFQGFVAATSDQMPSIELFNPVLSEVYIPQVAIEQINDWEGSDFLYCTEFLFTSADLDTEQALSYLATIGDCELLVGAHPNFKIHVHTNEPGQVLNYMTERGQVKDVHIHNMQEQSEQRNADLLSSQSETATEAYMNSSGSFSLVRNAPKQRGYIAVASGYGMQKILESLGVDVIVNGGQTMNPSTAELLQAIEAVNADEVIIFPNNKNIIMAAQAAADVSDKQVAVVPTRNVPASFSALFVANPGQSLEEEVEEMIEAASEVRAAEITHAIKDATSDHGQEIHTGDVIGISDDSIEVVGKDVDSVALQMIKHIADDDCDTLTLLAGDQLDQATFEALVEQIEASFPELEVDARRGDQPLYPLVMAAE